MESEGLQGKKQPDQKGHARSDETGQGEEVVSDSGSVMSGLNWRQRMVLSSQQTAGNARTQEVIRRLKADDSLPRKQLKTAGLAAQRSAIKLNKVNETIVNSPVNDAAGTTVAMQTNNYAVTPGYTMARRGAPTNDVLISVHILFMDPPATTGNDATGKPIFLNPGGTPIGASDPRRAAVLPICTDLAGFWNKKYELRGQPLPGPGGASGGVGVSKDIVLPLTFEAIPVWDPAQAHDNAQPVYLHGGADTGDASRADPNRAKNGINPSTNGTAAIDAGNWYLGRAPGQYGAAGPGAPAGTADPVPLAAIYAHEYGHLLGLTDEYSQSNPSTHDMLHRVTPQNPAEQDRMDTDLDRATSKIIILEAMRPQLLAAIATISDNVTAAVQAQQDTIVQQLATSLRASLRSSEVADSIDATVRTQLAGQTHVLRAIRASITSTVNALDYKELAKQVVISQLRPDLIGGIMRNLMATAVNAAQNNGKVRISALSGPIDMTIGTTGINTDPALSQLRDATQSAVTALVGTSPAHAAGAAGPIPPVSPSQPLLDQLMSLPNQWKTMGSLFTAADLNKSVEDGANVMLADGSLPGLVDDKPNQLVAALRPNFKMSANWAGTQAINMFLNNQMQPYIQQQLDMVLQQITNEPSTHHTAATPTGTTGSATPPPPDPAMAARVAQIQATMQNALAQARAVRDTKETTPAAAGAPIPAGATVAPPTRNNLHVDITTEGMMGNNMSAQTVRPDYMSGIADAFNNPKDGASDLRHSDSESAFVIEPWGTSPITGPGDFPVPASGPNDTAVA